ncbi:MAG: twin-arginine translocase subunit TatC [Bacteroidetes bacterium]|nr:twin-arginine translocase subunit TatC [Bacteroidota bacterium]
MPLDQGSSDDFDKKEMSFFDHIDSLRGHIMRSLVVLVILIAICFTYIETLFTKIIIAPINPDFLTYRLICKFSHYVYHSDKFCIGELNIKLVNLTMQGQFVEAFKISIITAIVVGFPYFLFELWRFIRPALKSSEKKISKGLIASCSLLFFLGVLFGYYILSPISLNFFANFSINSQIENQPTFQSIVSLISFLVIGTGLMFELPILMYFLARIGFISSGTLKKFRRYALLVIIVVAAIVTPPDVFSQIILTIPIYFLFELGITLTKNVERKQAKNDEQ